VAVVAVVACRMSRVSFYCCSSEKLPKEVKKLVKAMQPVPYAVAQLAHVQVMMMLMRDGVLWLR
jgi:hypothetical protein